jgi:lipoic acid synthetase
VKKEGNERRRLPGWMKVQMPHGYNYSMVKNLIVNKKLNTICVSGNCPNKGECWSAGTATFMILGNRCTRNCRFCQVNTMKPLDPDQDEPRRLAEAIKLLGLKHCVITSVARDDLSDGGARFWAETIKTIKHINPGTTMEALIPDFNRGAEALDHIINEGPEVISHNLETVRRLTPGIRGVSTYDKSIELLKYVAASGIVAKSGIMAGLGETEEEVLETMDDLLKIGVKVFTIGQYLQPSEKHIEVHEYINPETFEMYRQKGLKKGLAHVESGPQVRSSYHAERHVHIPVKAVFEDLGLIDYREAWNYQEKVHQKALAVKAGKTGKEIVNRIIFCEHPHVYTIGRSGKENNLLINNSILKSINAACIRTNRGGDITYHGPGQIVGYPIFDLEQLKCGTKKYVFKIEESIINTLKEYGIMAGRIEGATGVWVNSGEGKKASKICAIGIRISKYVTMHGFALNVNTNLEYFRHINPCGYIDKGVTSMENELGKYVPAEEVKKKILKHIANEFEIHLTNF